MSDIKKYEPLWGTWFVDTLIGEGLYGKVYKVRREESGQTTYSAVKILSIPYDEAAIKQMRSAGLSESSMRDFAQALVTNIGHQVALMNSANNNKHIVGYKNIEISEKTDEIGWDILLLMDLLKSLPNHAQSEPMTEAEIVKLGKQICQALEICDQNKIIHLNIKPENIFVSPLGDYMLGDIGIAQPMEHAQAGLVRMDSDTCAYMAPEVYKGEQYNASADIYALGMLMYCLLNKNRSPFLPAKPQVITQDDRDSALQKRISGEPIPDIKGISPDLNALVLKACAYKCDERFAGPAAMLEALDALVGENGMKQQVLAVQKDNDKKDNDKKEVKTEQEAVSGQAAISLGGLALMSDSNDNDSIEDTKKHPVLIISDSMTDNTTKRPKKRKLKKPLRVAAGLIAVAVIVCGYVLAFNGDNPLNRLIAMVLPSNPSTSESITVAAKDNGNENEDVNTKEDETLDETLVEEESANEDKVTNESDSSSKPESTNATNVQTQQQKPATQPIVSTPQPVRCNLSGRSITDSKLSSMIKSGEIPKNVTELDLSNNQISDLSPLKSLTALTSLNLSYNNIDSSVTSLQSLTKLQYLYLNNNRISNFSSIRTLQSLQNLKVLHIQDNVLLTSDQIDYLNDNFADDCRITYSTRG